MADETLGAVATLYLGNILYSLELTAATLEGQGKAEDAGYYRAIARKLAETYGREKGAAGGA